MPDDKPAPVKSKKSKPKKATAAGAQPARPSVTVVPGITTTNAAGTGPRPTLIVCPLSVLSNWLVSELLQIFDSCN